MYLSFFYSVCILLLLKTSVDGKKNNGRSKGSYHPPTSQPTSAWVASCRQFQDTEASVEAIFTSADENAGEIEVHRVFVTDLVDIQSENPEVATMFQHNIVVGHDQGESVIGVNVSNKKNFVINPAVVTVSWDAVRIESLQVSAITGANSAAVKYSKDLYGSQDVAFDLYQNLTFDRMTAGISVFANYSDGTWNDVTLNSTIVSLSDQIETSEDAYGPMLTVLDYAHKEEGQLIGAEFPVCARNRSVSNTGYVDLNIIPIYVKMEAEFDALSNPYDYAAFFPFELPQSTYISVQVYYQDGHVHNFTDGFAPGLNPRCKLTLLNGTDLVYLEGNKLTAWDDALNGTVVIEAQFPDLYTITGFVTVTTANFDISGIMFSSYPYTDGILKNTVYLNSCSSSQQRLLVMAVGILTNGIMKDVSFNSTFYGDVDERLKYPGYLYHPDENTTVFVGESPGEAYIQAVYADSFQSDWEEVHVVDVPTDVIRLESYGHAPNDTLRGFAHSEWDFYKLRVYFDDGTIYPEIIHGITYDWLKPDQIVRFNSSREHAAEINASTSIVTLRHNYYSEVYLEAIDNCTDPTIMDSVYVYTNLKPWELDVDMGSTVGPKFGTKLLGEPIFVPFGIQANPDVPLTTFDMIMKFDESIISAPTDDDCASDESWAGYFECTTNNPPGYIYISGICASGGCSNFDYVNMGSVRFDGQTMGLTPVYGNIRRAGDAEQAVGNLSIVAGADDLLIATGTPTSAPTGIPTCVPSSSPQAAPSSSPTSYPTGMPSPKPTFRPSVRPTVQPTARPSAVPSVHPTVAPSVTPTFSPSATPTLYPTPVPTVDPTFRPTKVPTASPTRKPSAEPTLKPSKTPSYEPTLKPSKTPTFKPTKSPTIAPSKKPSIEPTFRPTKPPTMAPSYKPTNVPTFRPTKPPTVSPTFKPTRTPTFSPSATPTISPTKKPTKTPTTAPTAKPSAPPTAKPSAKPSAVPSYKPTKAPTFKPSKEPSFEPTYKPTKMPTRQPTRTPTTATPTGQPTSFPTSIPTASPTAIPTSSPTSSAPTSVPTSNPTAYPTAYPTAIPTSTPTGSPTPKPSFRPTTQPTWRPTLRPTDSPTYAPTSIPSGVPSCTPSSLPTTPTSRPSSVPTTSRPSSIPSSYPTSIPTTVPSSFPTYVVPSGITFNPDCDQPISSSIVVDMYGSGEVCGVFPAYGSVTEIISSIIATSSTAGYNATYSVVITAPFEGASYKFSRSNIDYTGHSEFSISTQNATYMQWKIELDVGSGSYVKTQITTPGALEGIGLFSVCIANLDTSGSSNFVSFRGDLRLPLTNYNCDIPMDGSFFLSKPPTSHPTSMPTTSTPSSSPTPAPTNGDSASGVSFVPQCDAMVTGDININDLPFMRESCGFFPGKGIVDGISIVINFGTMVPNNTVHVVVGSYTTGVYYRFGDEYVDIAGEPYLSDAVKNTTFIYYDSGADEVMRRTRVVLLPKQGNDVLNGSSWYKVCLVNVGFQTNDAVPITGTFTSESSLYDCNSLLLESVPFERRRMLDTFGSDIGTYGDELDSNRNVLKEMSAHQNGAVLYSYEMNHLSQYQLDEMLLSNQQQAKEAVRVRKELEKGVLFSLVTLLQKTVGLFVLDTSDYYHPIRQQALRTLSSITEEEVNQLYEQPKVVDFGFAPFAQTFKVPLGVFTLTAYACGASGGDSDYFKGGLGGCIRTVLSVEPEQVLYIHVGGQGGRLGTAGFFGGGLGSSATLGPAGATSESGGSGGGGSTDIRLSLSDTSSRVLVAGGGGGAGNSGNGTGGAGGGYFGGSVGDEANPSALFRNSVSFTQLSYDHDNRTEFFASGGMQAFGGLGGKHDGSGCGLNGYLHSGGASTVGGGGGGGYYGGGGGCYSGGAGGSSFAYGSVVHNFQGVHFGNGFVRIVHNTPDALRRTFEIAVPKPVTPVYTIDTGAVRQDSLVPRDGDAYRNSMSIESIKGRGMIYDRLTLHERRLQTIYVDPEAVDACTECVMGDVNGDCVFDAADAKILEVYVSLQLDRSHLTTCQNMSMDPNKDGYVNRLDVIYLLRVNVRKYRFLNYMEAEFDLTGIRINSDIRMETGEYVQSNITSAAYSIGTAYGDFYTWVQGTDAVLYPWGVQINPDYNQDTGLFTAATDYGVNENGVGAALIVTTYDDLGRTDQRRQYVFYCSPVVAATYCASSSTGSTLDPYLMVDISGYPTARPTAMPVFSSEPTSMPTFYRDLSTSFVTLVHPEINTVAGSALPTHSFPTTKSLSKWTAPFNTLLGAVPGAEATFGLSVAGIQYGTSTVTVSKRPIAYVNAVLKTASLYIDSRSVLVAYQVTDAVGHTQVDASNGLSMFVNNSYLNLFAAFTCLAPDAVSGIGSCSGDISSDWFTTAGGIDVDVVVTTNAILSVRSAYLPMVLEKPPVTEFTDANPYMLISLPRSPVQPGDYVTVGITANTGVHQLTAWVLTISYNTALLSYVGYSTGALYTAAIVVNSDGRLAMSTNGLAPNVNAADAEGTAVEIAYVTFYVLPSVANGVYSNAMNIYVNGMVNVYSLLFHSDAYGYVQDGRDHGDFINGQLSVYAATSVGVMAYSAQNELLNTAAVNGMEVYSSIIVEGISNGTITSNPIVTADSLCSVENTEASSSLDVTTLNGLPCVVKLSSNKASGSSNAVVGVRYNNMNASVPFRIWYPSTLNVKVTDNTLNRIVVNSLD